jgi:homoserine dehydrogenase
VYCEGITKISQSDLEYAKELGYTIKLLAIAKHVDEKIEARVHPTLIPLSHPLANVNNVYNGIYVKGDFVQDVMFYGRGAGSHPTGSAVAGDVIDIARNINYGSNGKISCTCFDKREIHDINEVVTRYYIRLLVSDKPKVLAAIASIFGDNNVSIALMNQKNVQGDKAEIVMVTHDVVEIDFRNAIEQIAKLPVVAAVCNWIRVEE